MGETLGSGLARRRGRVEHDPFMRALYRLAALVLLVPLGACISKGDTNITNNPTGNPAGAGGAGGSAGQDASGSGGSGTGGTGTAGTGTAGSGVAGGGGIAGTSGQAGSGQAGSGQAGSTSGGGGNGGTETNSKCTLQPSSQVTDSETAKAGLSVSSDGTHYLAAWMGSPSATYVQYAMTDGNGAMGTIQTIVEAKPSGQETTYVDTVYSPTSQQFVTVWSDAFGSEVYPRVQFIKPDGGLDGDSTSVDLGAYINFASNGRHHIAVGKEQFLVSYYWCPGGGAGCPNLGGVAAFNNSPYVIMADPSKAISWDKSAANDQKLGFGLQLQTLAYTVADIPEDGFLIVYNDGLWKLGKVSPTGTLLGMPPFEAPNGVSNINQESRFAWDGGGLLAFSYGSGSGSTQGNALRMEKYALTGARTMEKKITIGQVRPTSIDVDADTVSVIATDGSAIYFLQRKKDGTEVLAPEIVATGAGISQAYLLRDASGYVVFWLAKTNGFEQVFSARISCVP